MATTMTAYQMAINNVARYIRSGDNRQAVHEGDGLDAFKASTTLAVAFCKSKEEVLEDILCCQASLREPS
jgi:hypothetical protein